MDYELAVHAQRRIDEREIRIEWLELALEHPTLTLKDADDPSLEHRFVAIEEADNRVLRVVCDPIVFPIRVITVHFDRRMRGKL